VVTAWEIQSGVRRMGLQTNREGGSNEVLCLAYIHGSRLICLGGCIRESVCVGGGIYSGNYGTAEGYVDFIVSDTANPMRIWVGEGLVCAIDCGWYSGSAYMFIAQENGVVIVFKWDGKAGSYMFQARQELDTQVRLWCFGINAKGFRLVKLSNNGKSIRTQVSHGSHIRPVDSGGGKISSLKHYFAPTGIARKPNIEPLTLDDRYDP
jgi:hypothetical protein